MKIILAIMIAAAVTSAKARIGETPAQCKARYGEPLNVDQGPPLHAAFKKNGIVIMAEFFEGKAAMIIFTKEKTDILGKSIKMSSHEIEALKSANGQDREWIEQKIFSLDDQWQTEDGEIYARLDALNNWLLFMTKEHIERTAQAKKKSESENLSGF